MGARQVTGYPEAASAIFEDSRTGALRMALHQDGVIVALFFAAPEPVTVARTYVTGLLGREMSALEALAGRAAADRPDPGATVCACFDVGVNTLRAEIANGASTLEGLGQRTCAGTNCGSCKPELAALLAQAPKSVAAE